MLAPRHGGTARAAVRNRRAASEQGGVIAIGSSTGGIDALHAILSEFPEGCPPTLVVQHISGPYAASFARGLAQSCAARVQLAQEGMGLERGCIYVAPGNERHLALTLRPHPRCRLIDAPPVSGHRPSIDVLFRSCTQLGPAVRAALLTGMGRDGAAGLLEIRQAGGRTVGQDETTSIVFGMARVARDLGAVQELLPLSRIAAALIGSDAAVEMRR